MINIEIHNDDRQRAVEILKSKNFGNRSSGFNGNYEKQYTGLIGELTVHRLLGLDSPNYNEGRIDTDVLINNKKVDIKVFDVVGKLITSKKQTNLLDVSSFNYGIYNVIIKYNNKVINKKIIKK